jgi:hypothetical protein
MPDIVKSSPSCNGNGAVAVPTTGAASVDSHVDSINILLPRLKQITADLEAEIGGHILAIKAAAPNDWEAIVKTRCGISRSRAYELMAIADGTKTTEQTRRETNARQIRRRQKQAVVRDVTDSNIVELKAAHQRELADARMESAELQDACERLIVRYENKFAELSDARNLDSERDQLRKALGGIVELLAEMRGLLTHAERNRGTVLAKIARAETIATSALQPAKVVNLPAKQAA